LYVIGTLQILGLEICADTIVGDERRRGISGGQRKHVTTVYMFCVLNISLIFNHIKNIIWFGLELHLSVNEDVTPEYFTETISIYFFRLKSV